jgi:hypothetical protein
MRLCRPSFPSLRCTEANQTRRPPTRDRGQQAPRLEAEPHRQPEVVTLEHGEPAQDGVPEGTAVVHQVGSVDRVEPGGRGEDGRLVGAGALRVCVDLVETDQVGVHRLDLRRDLVEVDISGVGQAGADVELEHAQDG